MSFLRSLFSGVSGLRNHQTMMDVIGNNISNINTIGFKAGRATFSELYAQTLRGSTQPTSLNGGANPIQVGLGMTINSVDNVFTQGNLETTNNSTDLAVQGSGFFIIKKDGEVHYTRDGSFKMDANGRLVNPGTGAILQGKMADAQGVLPSGTTLADIQIALDTKAPAKATENVKFAGNLDASAKVGDTVQSSVSVFDALGNQTTVTITYTNTGTNTWSWSAAAPAPAATTSNGTLTFNSGDGTLNSVTGNPLTVTLGNGAPALSIALDFGTPTASAPGNFSGVTQTGGTSSVTPRSQDGYASGSLSGIEVDATGTVRGSFTNGIKITLGQIMLAEFNNPGGLEKAGDNMWSTGGNSGTPAIVPPGVTSKLVAGALEQSNVDLADEFTKMITAQRGFQANARVITTSDEFLQEVVGLKR
jgi:flagellar hook protein FlgE